MTDPTSEFFRGLGERGADPRLGGVNACVRFDATGDGPSDSWVVVVNDGAVTVTSDDRDADCVLTADRGVFNSVVTGRANAMAAVLRGELALSGDPEILVAMQRILPGPPGGRA